MDVAAVDEAVEKYFRERMGRGKKPASERFLSYVYMRYRGEELKSFMRAVVKNARYSIHYLQVIENPFKGPELPWFVATSVVAAFSLYLLCVDNYRLLGIFIFSATLTSAWTLISGFLKKWKEIEVMIAIYAEIAEIAEGVAQEQGTAAET
ncbi:MAG TPA: hypothetical protein VNX25_10485 [Verrucomicrobiae bacterium]|nr:hypothetical protein [Verrucomicrobiae bacterium]